MLVALLVTRTASAGVILSFTGGFQTYTVDTTGLYNIVAYGAQGGNVSSNPGGLGAQIGGDFLLTQGQILTIAVGGQGESALYSMRVAAAEPLSLVLRTCPSSSLAEVAAGRIMVLVVALVSPLLREERP